MNPALPILAAAVSLAAFASQSAAQNPKPVFASKVVTAQTPGHVVEVSADLSGAKKLFLAVDDGGNGFACDWADWVEPRLIVKGKEVKLTDLKWKSASADWGNVAVGKNAGGGELRVNGQPVAYGIGVHAISVIEYDLPEGATKFMAKGGLDDGGTNQQGGQATSVRFLVFTEKPKIAASGGGGGGGGGSRDPEDALAGLTVHEDLEATLFASEPMMLSPSAIDVDHRGRVWVCEVINYRGHNGKREEGDRILIIEDTDGDAKADKAGVFYQGRDIDSAHGICVLGDRALVSAGEEVFWLIDDDGNGKADRKEMMFTKTGGKQHDHGIHAFHFGADGKLYFNFGNAAKQLCDKDGNIITDKAGNEVRANRQPYQEGMVFRCDLDGSNVETLGWNFRNNWEVASDSFGALWQSDNDDDGNRGVRINYVMEFGNFGYKDELTGAGWNQQRVGWEEEIPLRHWHLNDPGVVPNLLQTGAGSPTGIIVYEGDLLPEVFRGQVIHCDAGPNVVRAYPAKKSGAGYEAETVDILKGDGDRWFRPSDVVAAPDGSLIVADWYDPGVGGHGMGDQDRGRLFRVAPPATPYRVPKLDFSTVEGAAQALGNANLEARYLAWQKLHAAGETAIPALKKLWESDNPRLRARAFWLLAKIPGKGADFVNLALKDSDADLRVAAVRAARQLGMDLHAVVAGLAADPAPEVRRECAIALAHDTTPEAAALWAKLAAQHAAGDRWYLEALGIGMRAQPEACFKAWRAAVGEAALQSDAGQDIVWRSRVPEAMPLLVAYVKAAPDAAARGRYLRAFDFMPDGDARRAALIDLLVAGAGQDASQYAMQKLGKIDLHSSPELKAAVAKQIDATRGTAPYVETVALFDLKDETAGLEKIVEASNEASDLRAAAAKVLLDWGKAGDFLAKIRAGDAERAKGLLALMPKIQNGGALEVLKAAVLDAKLPNEIRHAAIESCRDFRNAEVFLANLAIRQQIPEGFTPALTHFLHASRDGQIREAAAKHLPLPEGAGGEKLPPLAELAKRKGNADSGKAMFAKGTCITCHRVGGQGIEFGPDLSEIGGKLAREDMFRAILDPGAAISHGFATVEVNAKNGDSAVGYVVSDTDDTLSIKIPGGLVRDFKKADLKSHNELPISLMPAGLEKILTAQELVDLVAYLETLKK